MKKILLSSILLLGIGGVAMAQEKAASPKPKLSLVPAASVTTTTTPEAAKAVSKSDLKDDLAERTAAKQAYLNKNKDVNSAKAPAKAALTSD